MKVAILLMCLVACGATGNEKILHDSYAVAIVADDHLDTFSHDQEKAILAAATTKDEFVAKISTLRTKVNHATVTIDTVIRAVAAAAVLKDDHSLSTVVQLVLSLRAELTELGVKL